MLRVLKGNTTQKCKGKVTFLGECKVKHKGNAMISQNKSKKAHQQMQVNARIECITKQNAKGMQRIVREIANKIRKKY